MITFNFLFGISLGTFILQHSDNRSKSLQHDTITAAEGQQLAKLTIDVLKSFLKKTSLRASTIVFCYTKVNLILMHQLFLAKKVLLGGSRLDKTDGNFHSPPEGNYRQIYYEALDLVIEAINSRFNQPGYKVNSRFNQPGYKVYRNVEDLVLNACRGCPYNTELSNVCDFYRGDISKMQLQAQLRLLQALFAEEKNKSELSRPVTPIFCSTTCIQ